MLTGPAPPSLGAWEVTQAVSLADPGWQTIAGALAHPRTGPKPCGCPKSRDGTAPAPLTSTQPPCGTPAPSERRDVTMGGTASWDSLPRARPVCSDFLANRTTGLRSSRHPGNTALAKGSLPGPRLPGGLTEVVEAVGVGAGLIRLLHKLEVVRRLVDDKARVLAAAVDDVPKLVPGALLHLEAGRGVLHLHRSAPAGCWRPSGHPLRPFRIQ